MPAPQAPAASLEAPWAPLEAPWAPLEAPSAPLEESAAPQEPPPGPQEPPPAPQEASLRPTEASPDPAEASLAPAEAPLGPRGSSRGTPSAPPAGSALLTEQWHTFTSLRFHQCHRPPYILLSGASRESSASFGGWCALSRDLSARAQAPAANLRSMPRRERPS